MPAAAEVRTVTVGPQRLRVAVRPGRPNGAGLPPRPPLLLINGIGARLEALEPFAAAVDPATEVIRFDPPGIGGSPLPPGPYRFTGLCRLIARLLTELGHDQADVLGISWGGAVAQHFAAFQRARCRRLVLTATAAGAPMVLARPAVLAQLMTPRRHLDRAHLEQVAGDLYGGSARTDWAAASTALHPAVQHGGQRPASSRGYYYQLAAVTGWTALPFLPWLRQPTLILAGDDDPIIPLANARLMQRLVRGSRLHVYPGGHLGLITEAAALAPVVDGFLAAP